MHCVLMGPSESGKTGLLATLHQATHTAKRRGCKLTLHNVSESMRKLTDEANSTVVRGLLPTSATIEPVIHYFTLAVTLRLFGFPFTHRANFSTWDGQGGIYFKRPDVPMEAPPTEAQGADAIILCLEATKPERVYEVVSGLANISSLSCDRVVICLTKADLLFGHQNALAGKNPFEYARDVLMSKVALSILQSKLNKTARVAFGWCSAYGFTSDGRANFDKQAGRMLAAAHHAAQVDGWRPFRVLDPFAFVVADEVNDLVVVRAEDLA